VSTLRIGVIGAGKIAHGTLPKVSGDPLVITGVTDASRAAAESLSAKLGSGVVFDTIEDLLASDEIDGVYVATPPGSHASICKLAVEAGKHVLCEKPLTVNAREAVELATLAETRPDLKVACCASRFRFYPAASVVESELAAGSIGQLRVVRTLATLGPPKPLGEMPGWKADFASAGGGIASDWGVYELEWLRGTLGQAFDPISVHAILDFYGREGSEIESGFLATIVCNSGLVVRMSRVFEIGPKRNVVEIRGELGGIDTPFLPTPDTHVRRFVRPSEEGSDNEETVLGEFPDEWPDIMKGPFRDFAASVTEKRPVKSDARSQVLVHRVLDAIYESARSGRVATIEQ
jgi:predicted dehydrogenase